MPFQERPTHGIKVALWAWAQSRQRQAQTTIRSENGRSEGIAIKAGPGWKKKAVEEIAVLIVDDNDTKAKSLTKLLQFEADIKVIGMASNGEDGLRSCRQQRPDVILMDASLPDMDGFRATEELLACDPIAQVIFLGMDDDRGLIEKAMDAGAAAFLICPVEVDKLAGKIRKAAERGRKLRSVTAQRENTRGEDVRRPGGKVVSVYSARGGAGCTTLAINLALALNTPETPTALVDAHLQYGDVAAFLNLQPSYTLDDVAPKLGSLDEEMISQVVLGHESGLRVLLAPVSLEGAEAVTPEALRGILQLLRRMVAYVVVDLACHLDDVAVTVLEMSDLWLVVLAPDIPSIKNTRVFLDMMERLSISTEQALLVLNQVDRRNGLRGEHAARALRRPVAVEIPFEREAVMASINRGEPLMWARKTHPLSSNLLGLSAVVKEHLLAAQARSQEDGRGIALLARP